jgi:molybdate transport system ATP-binding protein
MSLEVRISHHLGGFTLDVAFDAPPGVTVLFGPSGAGKSSVIAAIAGLIRPAAARIAVAERLLTDTKRGVFVPPHRRRLGLVFQDARLFPHLTVRQNLAYGRWFARGGGSEPGFDRVVEMLGIGALLDRRPATLSGGERSRVALGRAMLARPQAILADEPLAALDEARKAEILPYFERLRDETAIPVLYVSHAPAEVARLATTIVAMADGRVLRTGPAAEVLSDPAITPLGARGAGAVLEATVAAHHDDGLSALSAGAATLLVPALPQPVGSAVRVRIAAHDVVLSLDPPGRVSALNCLAGRVVELRTGSGPGALVVLETAAGRLLARVTQRSVTTLGLAPGAQCHAIVKSVAVAPDAVG